MQKENQKLQEQAGFTLVEIAIVLVIIGLLLGGVLKGQEMIKNAKVKSAASDINAYSVALMSYEDRYGNLRTGENFVDPTDKKPSSLEMLKELSDRGLITFKEAHSLGGKIVLAKNEEAGSTSATSDGNGAVNGLASTTIETATPKTFNWAVCYTGIEDIADAQSLIRAIDGQGAEFTGDNSAYLTGKARWVKNDLKASTATDGTVVCFEL